MTSRRCSVQARLPNSRSPMYGNASLLFRRTSGRTWGATRCRSGRHRGDMADHAGTTFGARLVELAATDGDRAALTFESVTLSRSELVDSVARLVARFAALGVGVGATVTIGLANSVELVQAIFAAWWVGATPHVLSPRLAAPERAAIIELAEPALVVGLTGDEVGRVRRSTSTSSASRPQRHSPERARLVPMQWRRSGRSWGAAGAPGDRSSSSHRSRRSSRTSPRSQRSSASPTSVRCSSPAPCRTTHRSSSPPSACSSGATWS